MGKKFFGSYLRNLDAKGRLLLPSNLVKAEGLESLYVLKGFDGCLSVYLPEAFEELMEELSHLDQHDPSQRAYIRIATSSMRELKFDSHGRILLPTDLLEEYGLGKEVMVNGVLDHLEIWDKKAYASYTLRNGAGYDSPLRRS